MEWMKLIQPHKVAMLLANYEIQLPLKGTPAEVDFIPVVRLFNPVGAGTWILSECDPEGIAFGICDIHYAEMGYVAMQELWELRLPGGIHIEEDLHWTPTKPLSHYVADAKAGRRI